MGRQDLFRRRDFFNLRTTFLLRGPLRCLVLFEMVDWDEVSLLVSAVEDESQESSLGIGLGRELGVVAVLGIGLGTGLGKIPGLGTELGTEVGDLV